MSETLDSNKCFIFIKGLKLINYRVRRFEILITFAIIFFICTYYLSPKICLIFNTIISDKIYMSFVNITIFVVIIIIYYLYT